MKIKQTKLVDFGRRSGLKVHPVGIGAMRLPEDVEKAVLLLRQAIDAGMIYIDTSRGYGDSEIKVGKALKDGYRSKVILSTKWCPWNLMVQPDDDMSADCAYKRLLESMKRLDVDYLDFYQLWSINNEEQYIQTTRKGGMLDGILRAMKEGLVRHTGFTTHDRPENISRYIDEADWCEAILFTYNMLDRTYETVLAKAHQKGIATVVMNPICGGVFAQDSEPIKNAVRAALGINDVVEAAHRWLKGNENIDAILCGIEKPYDITSTLANYEKQPLTAQQRKRLEEEFGRISQKSTGFCVNCGYCLPCPAEINIPGFMHASYFSEFLKVDKRARGIYSWQLNPSNALKSADPDQCNECGKCEQKCTQRIKIMEMLRILKGKFGQKSES
jgi:hypothetical protein